MINTLFVFLGILGFSYYYSIGAYFVLKKLGYEKAWKAFLPFYAFQLINKVGGTFSVFTIPVRKYTGTVIVLTVVVTLACLYGFWGNIYLPIESIGPLWEIMILVISICGLIFYVSLISSTLKLFLRFQLEHTKLITLLVALVLPMPFVYIYLSKKELRILKKRS
ncbi:MAG: hypothetical protein IKB70_09330 [Bacilli bacterium]|nr:hypothetical protein [Bacilli bacterium]